MAALALLVLFVAMTALVQMTDSTPTMVCPVNYVKRGCYHDKPGDDRRLPHHLANGRHQLEEGWGNWDMFIPAFICKCASAALNKGYKYFGIQFYGECWSGNVTSSMYQSFSPYPGGCVNTKDFKNCTDQSELCVGKGWANFVYEIQIPTTKPPAIDCRDKLVKCEEYASRGLCDKKYPEVLQYCPYSCELCSKP